MKKKILFFSHAVTMAHVARPLRWIDALDTSNYEIYFASDERYRDFIEARGLRFISIPSIDPAKFAKIVDAGAPIYDAQTFDQHVASDLALIETIRPDLVIGDFRHSLSVSCRLAKVPYLNMTSAYWSTRSQRKYPLPEAPIIRLLGETGARLLIGLVIPIALKINFYKMAFLLRKSFARVGLKFFDYRDIICDGDFVAYFDVPEMTPLMPPRPQEKYVGPMIWSAPVARPDWWEKLEAEKRATRKKVVWVTLGSSGNAECLPTILDSLGKFDVCVLLSLSGKPFDASHYPHVYSADMMPVEDACRISDLVVCNGGSPMTNVALYHGLPVVGVIGNNDQLLNMAHVEDFKAGVMLRYWNLSNDLLESAFRHTLFNSDVKAGAAVVQGMYNRVDVSARIREFTAFALARHEKKDLGQNESGPIEDERPQDPVRTPVDRIVEVGRRDKMTRV